MKHRITFFTVLMIALAIPQSVMAQDYNFSAVAPNGQTLFYAVNGSNVSVVPQNSSDPYYTTYPTGDLVIPSSVTYGSTTYSVTSIGDYAFGNCYGLTSVTIPESVTSIGDYAFYGSGLTSVSIPSSVTSIGYIAFDCCSGLTSISVESGNTVYDSRESCNAIIETATNTLIAGCMNTVIPGSVTSIGDCAFETCYGLTSVTIPEGVISIGYRAFSDCSGLTSVTIPSGVTSIGDGAFYYCSGLTSVTIPEGVTSIGEFAFARCSGLTLISVESGNAVYDSREGCNAIIETATNTLIAGCKNTVIPSSVTSIGDYAFFGCDGLTSVTIPSSVTTIGRFAFDNCSGLTSVTIPEGVTSIGRFAFDNCSGLTSISVESGNTVYDSREGCNALIETATNTLIAGCMNTVIPEGVTSIGDYAFYYCSGLTSVTIPGSVTSIGNRAFFSCSGLTSVTIPEAVTSIGNDAFIGCNGLTSIECLAMVPPTMGTMVFYNTNIPVYVPCGKLADYQAANGWSSFTNIQELDGCVPAGPTNIAVYADGNDIVVEGAAGNTVTLYDNGGNTLSTSTAPTGTPLRFDGLSNGTYYVKIGVLPARMKVEVR